MTNEERRKELARARRKAVEHAVEAETAYDLAGRAAAMSLATMWAEVAQCLKVGGTDAIPTDGPDGHADGGVLNADMITR